MRFDPDRHHRATIRLPYHPYAQGIYFVTICSFERQQLFGTVRDGIVELTRCGRIVDDEWRRLQLSFAFVHLDAHVIMPDHLHGIVEISQRRTEPRVGHGEHESTAVRRFPQAAPGSLPSLIGRFKSGATKRVNALRKSPGMPVWQTRYYDHVIRSQHDLDRIRRYIITNPFRWQDHGHR